MVWHTAESGDDVFSLMVDTNSMVTRDEEDSVK